MNYFQDKKILISGAAGGFGGEFVRQLLIEGARLILTDIGRDVLARRAEEIQSSPGEKRGSVIAITASDLSSAGGREELYRFCRKEVGDIDILINNAGIISWGYFHEIPADRLHVLMEVNALAPMHLTRLFLPDMVRRGQGQVAFLSSVAGYIPTAFETSYSASKFAVRGFGMALSREVKKWGIGVTIIYPFFANTGMINTASVGSARVKKLSSIMVDSPAMVVRCALRGIRKRKLHVHPGFFSKITYQWTKCWPVVYVLPVEEK